MRFQFPQIHKGHTAVEAGRRRGAALTALEMRIVCILVYIYSALRALYGKLVWVLKTHMSVQLTAVHPLSAMAAPALIDSAGAGVGVIFICSEKVLIAAGAGLTGSSLTVVPFILALILEQKLADLTHHHAVTGSGSRNSAIVNI